MTSLVESLMAKSRRALRSARLELGDGDTDGAVNRSYYAMLNSARASLLSAGIPEENLPKTHSGMISAFGEHVVKSGKVGAELGRSMNKVEALRLRADYTGMQLDTATAEGALVDAERFVRSVERAFGLQPSSTEAMPSEGRTADENDADHVKEDSLWDKSEGMEERRRRAVQDWLKYRKTQRETAAAAARERENDHSRDQNRASEKTRDLSDDPENG